MQLLAITRRTQPNEAPHNRPDFADLAEHHALCIICPVPWTAMMHAVVGGLRADTSESSAAVQVLYPTYYATPSLVTTRVGGNREIAHLSYSRLVIAGAIGDLADSIAELLERPLHVPRDLGERVNLTREASAALFAEHVQGASRLAALLIAHLCPISSLFAPCDPGAALRKPCPKMSNAGH